MKLYDENATIQDIEEQIDILEYCADNLDTIKNNLEDLDKKTCSSYIKNVKQLILDIEMEIECLKEEKQDKEEQERAEGREELRQMNYEYEKSRL